MEQARRDQEGIDRLAPLDLEREVAFGRVRIDRQRVPFHRICPRPGNGFQLDVEFRFVARIDLGRPSFTVAPDLSVTVIELNAGSSSWVNQICISAGEDGTVLPTAGSEWSRNACARTAAGVKSSAASTKVAANMRVVIISKGSC